MRSRLRNNITKEPSHRYILYELSINHDLTIIDIDALLGRLTAEFATVERVVVTTPLAPWRGDGGHCLVLLIIYFKKK